MATTDPYGQQTFAYGPKQTVLNFVRAQRIELLKLEHAMRAQHEILNDATRIAVLSEFVAELKKDLGNFKYEQGYGQHDFNEVIEKLEGTIRFIENYGWYKKYSITGETETPSLEDLVERALIRGGISEVQKLFAK